MELSVYQQRAQKTDRVPNREGKKGDVDIIVPLLGLAGEAGELLSEYKKHLRDGKAHQLFKDKISEELGDLLWYVANVATKFDLDLDSVARKNLRKTHDRWGKQNTSKLNFDATFADAESFPRQFEVELREVSVKGHTKIRVFVDGKKIGDDLTDNADDPDGYRFHDVFHLGYVAVLGWSPVIRKLMKRKRKSDPQIDEVQDGGRAQVIDEAVAALVFEYARHHSWLNEVPDLDYQLLRTVKGITSLLEVKQRSLGEWQSAILMGFEVWRQVLLTNGGRILVDLDAKRLEYIGGPQGVDAPHRRAATRSQKFSRPRK